MVQPVETIGVSICRPAPEPISDKLLTVLPAICASLLALGVSFWVSVWPSHLAPRR